jgi:hypothetical protein
VAVGGEPAHINADLGDDNLARQHVHAVDGMRKFYGVPKGHKAAFGIRIDLSRGLLQGVDLVQVEPQQKAMPRTDAAGERLDELGTRRLDATVGRRRELVRIGLARDHHLDHGAPALAHDVGDRRVEFDVGVLQGLLRWT